MSALSAVDVARDSPDHTALTGEVTWSYRLLAEKAEAIASRLCAEVQQQSGVYHQTPRVAFVASRSPEVFAFIHGLLHAGLCAVPLHPRWTTGERARALWWIKPELYVSDVAQYVARAIEETQRPCATTAVGDTDPFAIVFSSGSTGTPKAVQLSRGAVKASARASHANLPPAPGDCWLLAMPLAHVGALSVLTRALLTAGAVALLPEGPFAADETWDFVGRYGVTHASLVPTMLQRLLDGDRTPTTLETVLLGGSAALPGQHAACAARGILLLTTYGMTETFGQIVTARPAAAAAVSEPGAAVGLPLPGVELRVLEDGEEGELEVRGPTLYSGYLGPDGSLEPIPASGWHRTGDRVRFSETGVVVLGRVDDVVVTGGENVDPVEVESVLASCAGVDGVCVFGESHPALGQALVAVHSGDASQDALREAATGLAGYKRPKRYVHAETLPVLPSGKLDRREALRRWGRQ